MRPLVLTRDDIEARLVGLDLVAAMEQAFDHYSRGMAVIPPVGELTFDAPPGDVHIKYGYLRSGSHYVVKIASGFYENPEKGLSSCQGMMLLFDQLTGVPSAVLLDEGRLTDIRTGAAGAVAARHLAPTEVSAIGMIGTGIQAREQLVQLLGEVKCRRLVAWGRDSTHLEAYLTEARELGLEVEAADGPEQVADRANLIVTTTPSQEPLLRRAWIRPGTHITAVGSDTAHKQELESEILTTAHVISDSVAQSRTRGEVFRARASGALNDAAVVELGDVVGGRAPGRRDAQQVTVADLTGVAVQDLAIAMAVMTAGQAR